MRQAQSIFQLGDSTIWRNRTARPRTGPTSRPLAGRSCAQPPIATEIALLRPGEAVLYHEGNLARDIGSDPIVAGRAAAFRDATEAAKGWVAQRCLGFEWYQYIFWRTGT
jgi:hypothetical protein